MISNAEGRTRTGTDTMVQEILSPLCLPSSTTPAEWSKYDTHYCDSNRLRSAGQYGMLAFMDIV